METKQHIAFIERFTACYQENLQAGKYLRELECLKVQYPAIMKDPERGDLFVGRYEMPAIGFTPQEYSSMGGLGYYLNMDCIESLLSDQNLASESAGVLAEIVAFWKNENTAFKVRSAYSEEMKYALPSDRWTEDSAVAFPLYRMAGAMLDYHSLLKLGINGLQERIKEYIAQNPSNTYYSASLEALELFKTVCFDYIERLKKMDRDSFPETAEMIEVLDIISNKPPATLREAIQLMFLYNIISGSLNYGRMDDYLGSFLINDIDSGILTNTKAEDLLESLWRLMIARNTPTDGRVIIGGRGRQNEQAADMFALLAIRTSMKIKDILPQLTLRFYEGQNKTLMEKGLESIAQGNTFPMLYNDDVNIGAVQRAFNISREEAEQYTPYGCGEYVIQGKSFGTPSGVINLLKALEITLYNGVDPVTGNEHGLKLKSFGEYDSFDSFLNAFYSQVNYFVGYLAEQEALEYKIAGQEAPFLYLSMLYDDCLERGKAIFEGGIRHLGGTIETYGNTNAADSLFAIKQHVYEKKHFSPDTLLEMIRKNYHGFEKEHTLLINTPKYGNDDQDADAMYLNLHRFVCHAARSRAQKVGLDSYLVVNINNSANTILGRTTFASADGRREFMPMANGNSAAPGMDTSGITAYLNSISRPEPDIHAGYVQNVKLSPGLFKEHFDKLKALFQTYFKLGGTQLMINVVRKEDMLRALDHPEEFPNLIVRVGGFSARFVELEYDVQMEIINRTSY